MTRRVSEGPLSRREDLRRYFMALGLPDDGHLEALVERVSAEADPEIPGDALRRAQLMTESFLDRLGAGDTLPGAWLEACLADRGQCFPDRPEAARPYLPVTPEPIDSVVYRGFAAQTLHRRGVPRWLAVLAFPLSLSLLVPAEAAIALGEVTDPVEFVAWGTLMAFLTFLVAVGLTTAVIGFVVQIRSRPEGSGHDAAVITDHTAVVVPVYEEDPGRVLGMLVALWEGLSSLPGGDMFEFFVLSDTRSVSGIRREEQALRQVRSFAPDMQLNYRRRRRNTHRKAGNLADFFSTFGGRFDYAVILDADSVMRPNTVIELIAQIAANPRVGLIQAPLRLHRSATLFARTQQFTGATVGRLSGAGLTYWAGDTGNYYGHNAVVRVQAFLDSCALPDLPGRPPLGGQLLSHDFVEAALLRRNGWKVRMADNLDGSYEECPPTLEQFMARDRRWSQGNLQHLRIVTAGGLRPMSRLHLFLGAAAYLASPALILFTVLGLILAHSEARTAPNVGLVLTVGALVALLAPRVLGWLSIVRSSTVAEFGGTVQFTAGCLVNTLLALLFGPIMMVHHSGAVISILLGRTSGWSPQVRGGRQPLRETVRGEITPTICGVFAALTLALWAPGALWWLLPLWLPMIFAIPLAAAAASETAGTIAAEIGLADPVSRHPEPILHRIDTIADRIG